MNSEVLTTMDDHSDDEHHIDDQQLIEDLLRAHDFDDEAGAAAWCYNEWN